MAIVTGKSCGRLLYRPDEMSGTAWQCITCGPTQVSDKLADVPKGLADLLEEEYKRVVWEMIYPGSDAVTRTFPPQSRADQRQREVVPRAPHIARRRLLLRGEPHSAAVAGLLGFGVCILILLATRLGIVPHSKFALIWAVLLGFVFLIMAVAALLLMLILTYLSRRRFKRIKYMATASRSPALKIELLPSFDTFAEKTTPDQLSEKSEASQPTSTACESPEQAHS